MGYTRGLEVATFWHVHLELQLSRAADTFGQFQDMTAILLVSRLQTNTMIRQLSPVHRGGLLLDLTTVHCAVSQLRRLMAQ
jgi:hypothetical protein